MPCCGLVTCRRGSRAGWATESSNLPPRVGRCQVFRVPGGFRQQLGVFFSRRVTPSLVGLDRPVLAHGNVSGWGTPTGVKEGDIMTTKPTGPYGHGDTDDLVRTVALS